MTAPAAPARREITIDIDLVEPGRALVFCKDDPRLDGFSGQSCDGHRYYVEPVEDSPLDCAYGASRQGIVRRLARQLGYTDITIRVNREY